MMMINKFAKFLPLLAIVIAVPTFAASNYQSAQPQNVGYMAKSPMGRHLDRLSLTPEQKIKVQQLHNATKAQMDAVFTPEQRQQAKARKDQRRAMGDKWKSLNLTADQQAKLKEIRRSSKTQFEAILTPEQQAKQKAHGGRRGHGNPKN